MVEIRNKFYLNQEVWVRAWIDNPSDNVHEMRIVQILMQNGGICYGCINDKIPAHCAFAEEEHIFLTKEEAERGGD